MIYDMRLTQSYICQKIYELIDPNEINDYRLNINLTDYEKKDIGNTISLNPQAPIILGGDYNIARFRLEISIQVFQKYVNKDKTTDEWTRWNEYMKILDLFLNNHGNIPYFNVLDITENGSVEHTNSQGRIYEFSLGGDARMINEITKEEFLKEGGNC